ncbi:MAG TPA: hypothetical protein VHD56_07685 [Tepidisphaeraceae bacterium]|nr:hypothetical protein [Tepidisphaeraceae bacterium]
MRYVSFILIFICLACDRSQTKITSVARRSAAAGEAEVLPQSVAGNASVRGSVKFIGTPPVMQTFVSPEKCCQGEPPLIEQTVVLNPNGTLANVFVYLEDAPQTDGHGQPAMLLDQVKCQFAPHVLGIQTGQPLRIHSSDPTMHNVHFIPQTNPAKNLAMTQAGAEVAVKFEYAEFIRMKCDVHPWMTAWVGVFENPFFAVDREDGSFEIKGIPAGTYKLVAWHELYGRQEQSVTLNDGQSIESTFTFGRKG